MFCHFKDNISMIYIVTVSFLKLKHEKHTHKTHRYKNAQNINKHSLPHYNRYDFIFLNSELTALLCTLALEHTTKMSYRIITRSPNTRKLQLRSIITKHVYNYQKVDIRQFGLNSLHKILSFFNYLT